MSVNKEAVTSNSSTLLFVDSDQSVLPEWIDYNGHMTITQYQRVFERAMGGVYRELAIGSPMLAATGISTFTGQQHFTFKRELFAGDPIRITSQLIDLEDRKMHWFQTMVHAEKGYVASTSEHLILFVDMKTRHVTRAPADAFRTLERVFEAHRKLPIPDDAGRRIQLSKTAS